MKLSYNQIRISRKGIKRGKMDFTSKHFEIIDLYNLVPDSIENVENNPAEIDRMFYDGLAKVLESEKTVEDITKGRQR